MERLQTERIIHDLSKKIVFLVGPRQVGKTWLAKQIGTRFEYTVYLNYDHAPDRELIKTESWLEKTELLILDELHKMPQWKNYLKGVYDTKPSHLKIIVTGSARLDSFRQAGDSLAGRFFRHRLMPFSVKELIKTEYANDVQRLIDRGGFPEPFLAAAAEDAARWRRQYTDGLVRTDILDFEMIHDLRAIQLVLSLLQRRVGSPVSFTSIARDVGISPSTVLKYVQILESLYIVFRVTPFSRNIARSLLKEPKIYFFDNGMVEGDIGVRLENFVAVSLIKHVYGKNDYEGADYSLEYLRNKDGREADFCIVNKQRIETAIEVKASEAKLSPQLLYFCEKYSLSGAQLVLELRQERKEGPIEIRKVAEYLKELYL